MTITLTNPHCPTLYNNKYNPRPHLGNPALILIGHKAKRTFLLVVKQRPVKEIYRLWFKVFYSKSLVLTGYLKICQLSQFFFCYTKMEGAEV